MPDPVATLPPTPPSGSAVADAPMLRHAFADTNGTRLHYVTGGEGPAWTAERLLRFFGHEGDKA